MAVELAAGYVSASVKFDGATKSIGKLFSDAQKQATGAGKKTGEAYTKGLEAELKTAQSQVKKLSETVAKARDKEAEAAGKLRVATEKLNEARKKGASGSQLAAAEERAASAKRNHANAANALARETDGLTRAQKRQTDAQASLSKGPATSGGGKGFLSRFKVFGRDSGKAFNDAAAAQISSGDNALTKAGEAAGGKLKGSLLAVLTKGTAVVGAAVGIGTIISKGIERNIALDNAQAKMRQLGLEGENLDAVMKTVRDSVTGTAFGMGDAASAAAQALAAGVKPGEDLAQHMQTIVDAAAYGQVPLDEMATIMNRAKISGKVLTEDLGMLGDRGTPIYAWLQEDLGLSGDALQKFISDGNLNYEQLNATLQKHSQGAGQAMGDTFQGSLQNMGAAVGRLGEKLTAPFFNLGKAAFPVITGLIDNVTKAVDPLIAGIGEKFSNLFGGLDITSIGERIKSLFSGDGDAMPFLDTLKEVGSTLMDLGGTAFGVVSTAVQSLGQHAMRVFNAMKGPITSIIGTLKDTLLPVFQQIGGFVRDNWPKVTAAFDALSPVIAKVSGLAGGLLATAFKVLGGVIKFLFPIVAKLVSVILSVASGIIQALAPVVDFLVSNVGPVIGAIFKGIGTAAMWLWDNAIKPAWNFIKGAIGLAWEVISDIFDNWKRAFGIASDVAMALWETAVKPAWEAIKGGFQKAWDFVSPIFDKFKAGWETLKTGVVAAAGAIKNGVTSAFSGLANIIKAPLRALGSFLAGIPTSIMGIDIPGADSVRSWGEKLQGLRKGGVVRGPGTGTSDSILAWLSDGEGVVTANAMQSGGAGIVQALNQGWVPSAAYLRDMYNLPGYADGLGPGASYLRSLVMKMWPQIQTVGGVRGEDGYGEHSSGNALDIMIPNYQSPQGQAMGEQIAAFLRKNASALQLDGFIWRQQSFGYGGSLTAGKTMSDLGNDTANHMDHVHVILGKGRGAGAAPVSMPSVKLSMPSGMGGGSLGGGRSGKGMTEAQRAKNAADKQTRIDQLNAELAAAEQSLAEAEANSKTKESTLMSKRNAVQKKKDAIAKAERELEEIENTPLGDDTASGSSRSSGSDPFSKILDGFGELAQLGADGAMESLLPPGFENPFDWPMLKSAGGLLNFAGSLMPDPISRGIFGAMGAGMTGDASGAVGALGGIFMPQDQSEDLTSYGDMGGAYTEGSFGPETALNGGGVDNSIHVGENATMDMSGAKQAVQKSQYQQQRKTFATARK